MVIKEFLKKDKIRSKEAISLFKKKLGKNYAKNEFFDVIETVA